MGRALVYTDKWYASLDQSVRAKILYEDRKEERLSQGLCYICGDNPCRAGKNTCTKCAVMGRTKYDKRVVDKKALGLCTDCGREVPLPGCKMCRLCWLMGVAVSATHKYEDTADQFLSALAENTPVGDLVCAYSGELLTLGGNASVDHIFPSSRYPHLVADVRNLVWCDYSLNMGKADLDPRDPRSFSSKIYMPEVRGNILRLANSFDPDTATVRTRRDVSSFLLVRLLREQERKREMPLPPQDWIPGTAYHGGRLPSPPPYWIPGTPY